MMTYAIHLSCRLMLIFWTRLKVHLLVRPSGAAPLSVLPEAEKGQKGHISLH